MTKTILFFDKGKYADLKKETISACKDANNLIDAYNRYGLTRVTSLQDIENLISDPVLSFDEPMLAKVTPIPGLTPDPAKLAELYSIPRQDFLISVFGERVIKSGVCVSCLPDVEILTDYNLHRKYEEYGQYLTFKNSTFTVDQSKIDQAREQYIVYADEKQEAALQELESFVTMCNKFFMAGILTSGILQQMTKFSYSPDMAKLNLPFDKMELISKLNNLKT